MTCVRGRRNSGCRSRSTSPTSSDSCGRGGGRARPSGVRCDARRCRSREPAHYAFRIVVRRGQGNAGGGYGSPCAGSRTRRGAGGPPRGGYGLLWPAARPCKPSDADFQPGAVGLLGPNGAGKSTPAQGAARLRSTGRRPDAGAGYGRGRPVAARSGLGSVTCRSPRRTSRASMRSLSSLTAAGSPVCRAADAMQRGARSAANTWDSAKPVTPRGRTRTRPA